MRITEEWLQWLAKRDSKQPFFGFLFYDAPHGYSTPTNYPNPFQPDWKEVNQMELGPDFDKTPYLNRYRNAVHFVDEQLQRVMAAMALIMSVVANMQTTSRVARALITCWAAPGLTLSVVALSGMSSTGIPHSTTATWN